LNINLNINDEKQDCEIGTVWGVQMGGRKVNEGDLRGGLTGCIYLYETEQKTSCSYCKWGGDGCGGTNDRNSETNVQ
jgi:hypothetical protein